MRAFTIDRYGAPLTVRTVPDPRPGPGEVVVAIAATSVNPIDGKLQRGDFKAVLPMAMPLTLPLLIAGRAVQAFGACAAAVLARDPYEGPALTRALALVMITMAAAPGFSPALGTGMTLAFGWRSTFVLVAIAGAFVALCHRRGIGETLPPNRRRSARPGEVVRGYAALLTDVRFLYPGLTVSLVVGCLYSFFGAAPAILMTGMGLSSTGLSSFFAATVLVVFGGGMLTGPMMRR